jgi:hypothetical protein
MRNFSITVRASAAIRRIDAFERKKPVNGDRRIDEQQTGQGQAKDMNEAAIGIVSNYHGPGPGALVRWFAHASADREIHEIARGQVFTARQACAETLMQLY